MSDVLTVSEAVQEIRNSVIRGIRGVGTFTIEMTDGREFCLVSEIGPPLLERFTADGDLIERVSPEDIHGDVERVRCSVDELGGVVA